MKRIGVYITKISRKENLPLIYYFTNVLRLAESHDSDMDRFYPIVIWHLEPVSSLYIILILGS